MEEQKKQNYTINFTQEDQFHLLKSKFIEMIIAKDHPEVLVRAHELAEQMIKQQADQE
jgi:hypothetical protein